MSLNQARERVLELLRVLVKAARDLFVRRVEAQREIRRQHVRRDALRLVVRVRHRAFAGAVLRPPLVRAGGALRELPLELEQVLQEVVAELRRRARPRDLEPARDRVARDAAAEFARPSQTLRLEIGGLGVGADVVRDAGAVRLAEAVAARDQRDGLFVVHGHAAERFADVARGGHGIRLAVGTFRIHVDEPHLHGRERVREIALARVTPVGAEPLRFFTPKHVEVRLPDVRTAAAEIIRRKGATNHAIGLVTASLLRWSMRGERRILTVSRIQDDNPGLEGVALSLPTIVGSDGARQVIEPEMNEAEQAGLFRSAEVLRAAAASLE